MAILIKLDLFTFQSFNYRG